MRTAFFGGTFDPPHSGHIRAAREVLRRDLADRVLWAPALRPPHKEGQIISSFEDRLRMTELAVAGEKNMTVTDEENRTEGPSYTLSILDRLSARYPEETFLLMIGGDSLRDFHTWYHAAEIAEKYGFIVYPRPGATPSKEELMKFWPEKTAEKFLRCILPDAAEDPAASTRIRRMLNRGETPVEVAPAVCQYIQNRRLYRNE